MTDKFQKLYEHLLQELAQELKNTEKIFQEISQNILSSLAGKADVVLDKKIQLLENTYRQKISGLLTDFGKIYPGHIEVFPIPAKAGLLQRMEIRNRQAEELENILNLLLKQNNMKNSFSHTADKMIVPEISHAVCCCSCSESIPEKEEILPAILVCGHYNTGKTTLIQAITQHEILNHSKDDCSDIEIYETPAAVFIDSSNMDFEKKDIHSYAEMIFDQSCDLTDSSQIDTINCIWYCIDGSSMQISEQDQALISQFKNNLLPVITKCDLMQKEQIQLLMETLLKLVDKEQIIMVSAEDANGLNRLVNQTQKLCMKSIKRKNFRNVWNSFFKDKQNVWQQLMSYEADRYISWSEKRVAAKADTLETETTALICKIAVIYGIAVNSRTITTLKKCADNTFSAEKVIHTAGQAAKNRFASDTSVSSKRA